MWEKQKKKKIQLIPSLHYTSKDEWMIHDRWRNMLRIIMKAIIEGLAV